MHTTGPDRRDCGLCGKPIGNKPRVTLSDKTVICTECYQHRDRSIGRNASSLTGKCQLSSKDLLTASDVASAMLRATAGGQRGIRFEVIAILLANEVYDIASVVKMGGTQADAEKLMDDMMEWLTARAMELHGEISMSDVEQTTKQ